MKKRIAVIVLALVCLMVLAACGCDHEWKAATCDTPKTCALCDATEGDVLGHDWDDATCEAPKTCANCGKTKGDALGHDWQDATYEAPKTCATCGATEGEPLEQPAAASDFTSSACYATVRNIIDENMGDMSPQYEFDAESNIMYISLLAPEGTAYALAVNPTSIASAWSTLKTSFSDLSAAAQNLFATGGYPEVSCCIMLRNDTNPDKVLMGVLNGQVIFDVLSD